MTLLTLREALDAARAGGYGVGAFNVTDPIQAEAVLQAARETDSPVIVQTIAGSSSLSSDEVFWRLLLSLLADYPDVPAVLHLDHGGSYADCVRAIDSGFTSVMIDGSLDADRKPAGFDANVEVTARVTEYAHAHGVSVEGELGTIGGSEDGSAHAEIVLADPAQAEEFVGRTHVDALAVAIGTSHGAYKFDAPPTDEVLKMDLIVEIAQRVPDTHLVMHGSSSLPAELREVINRFGGALPESWGVPETEKVRSTRLGVRKINQGMDSHMAFTAAVRRALAEHPAAVDPAGYLRPGRVAMRDMLAERMRIFGQAGQADRHRRPAALGAGV